VGDLPGYVFSHEERRALVSVDLKLDPSCAIFVVSADGQDRSGEARIRGALIKALRGVLQAGEASSQSPRIRAPQRGAKQRK
jgi:hypothetical protein